MIYVDNKECEVVTYGDNCKVEEYLPEVVFYNNREFGLVVGDKVNELSKCHDIGRKFDLKVGNACFGKCLVMGWVTVERDGNHKLTAKMMMV